MPLLQKAHASSKESLPTPSSLGQPTRVMCPLMNRSWKAA
nr:MAG TPA: hypothetical protein [Caudoviricetes sp.]